MNTSETSNSVQSEQLPPSQPRVITLEEAHGLLATNHARIATLKDSIIQDQQMIIKLQDFNSDIEKQILLYQTRMMKLQLEANASESQSTQSAQSAQSTEAVAKLDKNEIQQRIDEVRRKADAMRAQSVQQSVNSSHMTERPNNII